MDIAGAVAVDLPVRGRWVALNTPAERVPSHGTDAYGQRYAFDFVRMNEAGTRFARQPLWRQFVTGIAAADFLAWDEPVLAAFGGTVIAACDGQRDRRRVHGLWELVRATLLAPRPAPDDLRPLFGNYVLVEGEPGVALYAHLREGSVAAAAGQRVEAGGRLGAVGNSGNSTMPHLHFHVMDRVDPLTAQGVACAFRTYREKHDGDWRDVQVGIPAALQQFEARAG